MHKLGHRLFDWPMLLLRTKPFLLAAIVALLSLGSVFWIDGAMATILAANIFFFLYLALSFGRIAHLNEKVLKKTAASDDAPVIVIFLITAATVAVAMASLFSVINAPTGADTKRLLLALLAVPLGWATIHLMSAIHYAHLFWQPGVGEDQPRKGLEFPGTRQPEGWDFVYFAFVIGMTAQTSDVQISGQHIRRFNLIHAIISFLFNTVLIAAAVNLAVSLKG